MTTKTKPKPKRKTAPPIDPSTLEGLVRMFGQVDGLWWPLRVQEKREPLQAVMELRSDYQKFGFVFQIESDGSASGWKRAQRQREALGKTGFVTLETYQRKPFLKFMPEGDAMLRDLLHLTDLTETTLVLKALFSFLSSPKAMPDHGGNYVSESQLFGNPGHRTENTWNGCTEEIFPLIANGYVEARSSTIGQVWYRPLVTKKEATALIEKWERRPTARKNKKPNAKLLNIYCKAFNAFRRKLDNTKPRDSSNIQIPLRATL